MATIDNEIEALGQMSRRQLLDEWRRVYQSDPPPLSADLLRRAVAYRMQELAYGGLSAETLRALKQLAGQAPLPGAPPKRLVGMRAGTRLFREWRGKSHAVVAIDGGFEFDGKVYGSLSQIAREITGTPWSGPKFFGLKRGTDGKGASGVA